MDLLAVEVRRADAGSVVFCVRDALADSLMRTGSVVVLQVFGQDGTRVRFAENQAVVEDLPAHVPIRRSQIAFIRGAWMAVRRMVVPLFWKMASKEAAELRLGAAFQLR